MRLMALACGAFMVSATVGGGVDAAAGARVESAIAGQDLPAYIEKTVHGRLVPQSTRSSFIPNPLPVGTVVPRSDMTVTAVDGHGLRFGLATYPTPQDTTYPAISTNGGGSWRIDGPLFHVAAAQGASVITNVGPLGSQGAYFWGRGGNVVWVTTDRGSQWWSTGFSYGVHVVSATHGVLNAAALGNQLKGGEFETFLYVSKDSGRTWTLRGRLGNVES
ncbi:MAG: hypothetical protein ACLPYY_18365 [Acidimicrobiales bacterium]